MAQLTGTTPRRSPRLAHSTAAVRTRLRNLVSGSSWLDTLQQELEENRTTSLIVEIKEAEVSPNKLQRLLVVTRKLQSYHVKLGPYDAVKLVLEDDGKYRLYVYDNVVEEGMIADRSCHRVVQTSKLLLMELMNKLADHQLWIACPGIAEYSNFQDSIGYNHKDVVLVNFPPNSARSYQCPILYQNMGRKRSCDICQKCTSLKWDLQKRKRTHDKITPDSKAERWQSCHSKVRFDYLSPTSKRIRIKNMSVSIHKLRSTAEYYADRIERIALTDVQNEEIGQLVDAVATSSDGMGSLDKIYSEADAANEGLGETVKCIWDKDAND